MGVETKQKTTTLLKIKPTKLWAVNCEIESRGTILGNKKELERRCLVFSFLLAYYVQTHRADKWKELRNLTRACTPTARIAAQMALLKLYGQVVEQLHLPVRGPHPKIQTLKKLCDKYDAQVFVIKASDCNPIDYLYPPLLDVKKVHIFLYKDGVFKVDNITYGHVTAVKSNGLPHLLRQMGIQLLCLACTVGIKSKSSPHRTCGHLEPLGLSRCDVCYRFERKEDTYLSKNKEYNKTFCDGHVVGEKNKCVKCQMTTRNKDCQGRDSSIFFQFF